MSGPAHHAGPFLFWRALMHVKARGDALLIIACITGAAGYHGSEHRMQDPGRSSKATGSHGKASCPCASDVGGRPSAPAPLFGGWECDRSRSAGGNLKSRDRPAGWMRTTSRPTVPIVRWSRDRARCSIGRASIRSHRRNGERASQDLFPSRTAKVAGHYGAADVACWHDSDLPRCPRNVCCRG